MKQFRSRDQVGVVLLTMSMLAHGVPVFAQSSPDTPAASAPAQSKSTAPFQSRGVMILRASSTPDPAVTPATLADPPPPPPPPPPPLAMFKACPRPFAPPAIAIAAASSDTAQFESQLRARLARRQPSVVVDMAKPFPVDSGAPPELSAWLTQVKASQGAVTMHQYCGESRGLMSFFGKLFSGPRTGRYAAANEYDAVLHVDSADQRVTQVEFRLRGAH